MKGDIMNTRTTLAKKALIRDMSVPVGQPAPMHIRCCGTEIPVANPFDAQYEVGCPKCGTLFDGHGYVLLNTVNTHDLARFSR